MARQAGINYLFPPDQIEHLPTWRFVLHVQAPRLFAGRALKKAVAVLRPLEWKAIRFERRFDRLAIDPQSHTVAIPIEVTEERRQQAGSLKDYESDVWKLWGHLIGCGFGDLFYEAVDWHEEDEARP